MARENDMEKNTLLHKQSHLENLFFKELFKSMSKQIKHDIEVLVFVGVLVFSDLQCIINE